MKYFIVAFALLSLLSGCVTERACRAKFPPVIIDSVKEETRVHLRDTSIVVWQSGAQISAVLPRLFIGTVEKQKGNLKLRVNADSSGTSIDCTSDSLQHVINLQLKEIDRLKKQVSTKIVEVKERYVPPVIYIIFGLLVAAIIYLFFKR